MERGFQVVRINELKQVTRGNHDAFRKLVQQYEQPVYQMSYVWMGNKADAGKLATDVFLYAYTNMASFLRKEQELKVWLFHIVTYLGKSRINESKQNESDHPILCASLEERLTLYLYHVQRMSCVEIAQVIGKKCSADIKALIQCGREKLRRLNGGESKISL